MLQVFVSVQWCIAELVCIIKLSGHRGIHPGANVGIDLAIWLVLMACTMFTLFSPVYSDPQAQAIALGCFGSFLM